MLGEWAFATSPYGLGLSNSRCWELTPREFDALKKVYEDNLDRWALQMADFRTAHFQREEGWTLNDFVSTRRSREICRARIRQSFDQQAIRRATHRQMQQMRAGTFDDSILPAGIRMTPEERAARQKKKK